MLTFSPFQVIHAQAQVVLAVATASQLKLMEQTHR